MRATSITGGGNLPLDAINKFQASAGNLPWEDIRRALPEPDQMRLVVVGDLKLVSPQLLSLGWGPIEVHDSDGEIAKSR